MIEVLLSAVCEIDHSVRLLRHVGGAAAGSIPPAPLCGAVRSIGRVTTTTRACEGSVGRHRPAEMFRYSAHTGQMPPPSLETWAEDAPFEASQLWSAPMWT
jgi:hypothetical protein